MNAVILTVKASYVANTKVQQTVHFSPSLYLCLSMVTNLLFLFCFYCPFRNITTFCLETNQFFIWMIISAVRISLEDSKHNKHFNRKTLGCHYGGKYMVFPLWYNMLATNCIKKPWSDFTLFIFIFLQHKSGEARVSCYCRVNCYCVHVYKPWYPRLFTPLFSRSKINAQTGNIFLVSFANFPLLSAHTELWFSLTLFRGPSSFRLFCSLRHRWN